MRLPFLSAFAALFAAFGLSALPSHAALPSGPAVFFSPHQDDETLFMGAAIYEHVRAKRQVLVVLLTDGSSSGVCQTKFNPNKTKTDAQVRKECTAYRDNEFRNAVTRLGATPVIPSNRMRDGSTTVAGLQNIMRGYTRSGYSLKTMTPYAPDHADHVKAGQALKGLSFVDSRYYVKPEHVTAVRNKGIRVSPTGVYSDGTIGSPAQAYRGFGWLSVPGYFRVIVEDGHLDYVHP